jgi:hypothetical protein
MLDSLLKASPSSKGERLVEPRAWKVRSPKYALRALHEWVLGGGWPTVFLEGLGFPAPYGLPTPAAGPQAPLAL